jgi:L-cysteine desulfidase
MGKRGFYEAIRTAAAAGLAAGLSWLIWARLPRVSSMVSSTTMAAAPPV